MSFLFDPKLEYWAHPSQIPFMQINGAETVLSVITHLGYSFWIPVQLAFEVPKCTSDLKRCQFEDYFDLI